MSHLSQLSAHIRQNTDLPQKTENVKIKHNKPTYSSEILGDLFETTYSIQAYFIISSHCVFAVMLSKPCTAVTSRI